MFSNLLQKVDVLYKSVSFGDLFISLFPKLLANRLKKIVHSQQKLVKQLAKKDKIKVAFFIQTPTTWKYDYLYRLFERYNIFDPIVVIVPFNVHLYYSKQEYINVMAQTEEFVKSSNYKYISAYCASNHKWIDVKKEVNPDIVFFTKPYKDTLPKYHVYSFANKLSCYVPYGFVCIDNYKNNYGSIFHSMLWKSFVETPYQKEYYNKYGIRSDENVVVSGCLGMEPIISPNYQPRNVWKPQSKPKKRIIWAPHHTVDYLFNFSNFFTYCELMLQLAEKYQDEIQIAFKPHPVLKFKLINIWGEEKTEEYYQRWRNLPNGQLEDGAYIDLFATSDAMIHDCASFTAEYLYTQKPTMFIVKDEHTTDHLNSFGEKCFALHYHAHSPADVERYVADVVIAGNDAMKTQRVQFFEEYLCPTDGVMPSQKIIDIILNEIKN